LALFALLAASLLGSLVRGYHDALSARGNDLSIYLDAAQAVHQGESPFEVFGYLYLPVFAVFLAPLAWLPAWLAVGLWQVLSWAALLWSAKACARLVGGRAASPWIGWFALLATWRLLDSNLSYGQANAFTLAAILASLEAALAGRATRAGLWVGWATAFKILPGILLLVYALQRRWRAFWVGLAAFAVLALLLPSIALGPKLALQTHQEWYAQVMHPFVEGGDALLEGRPNVSGQSLVALAYRNLTDTPLSGSDPSLRGNWVDWDPAKVQLGVRLLILLHGLGLLVVAWRLRAMQRDMALVPLAAWALCTVLLCAPVVHRAHMLWSMLGLVCLAVMVFRVPPSGLRKGLGSALGMSLAGIGLTTSGLIGHGTARWLLGHGVIGWSIEILWLALGVLCWVLPTGTADSVGLASRASAELANRAK